MEITSYSLHNLRNDEHFQFHTETRDLIDSFGAETLQIASLVAPYEAHIATLGDCLRVVSGSELTAHIVAADDARDEIVRGLRDAIKSSVNHFEPAKRDAAERVWHVFSSYGDIATLPLTEETASISLLCDTATTTLTADIATLGLGDWFTELATRNNAFRAIVSGRDDQKTAIPDVRVRELRGAIDAAYKAIVKQVNALVLTQGPLVWSGFVAKLNVQIDRYKMLVKGRKGGVKKPVEQVVTGETKGA